MIRSLFLGKTLCISNKHYKYYMAYLNVSFQGNGTDSLTFPPTKRSWVGRSGRRRKINCTGVLKHQSAMTWHGHGQVTWNIFITGNALTIKREQETFTSYLAHFSIYWYTKQGSAHSGFSWRISSLLPRTCILVCSLPWNITTTKCSCTSACNALGG